MSKQSWDSSGAWPWSSFGRGARFFESGEVRLAILSLLSEGPKHGYQLMKEMAERSGGIYKASAGSIYPTLQQLEDEDLIRSDQPDGKRVYQLTEAGRKELEKDPDGVHRIWERAEKWEEWGQYMRPDILPVMRPAMAVVKAAWQAAARANGNREREERIHQLLNRARIDLEAL